MSWPMLLDMSRDDCKRVLRRLELEGYSAVLSAFRAQGDLTKDKKKMLQDLQNILSISTERHRAEVRRAVNDEKFATIAHNIAGSDSTSEWLIEGRRLIPLMPRLVPQTAFTVTANQVANAQAEKNAMLPAPRHTAGKDLPVSVYSGGMSSVGTSTTKPSRPSSPASNVVVLPSGASIHIKGVLHPDEEEELQTRKRRRSQSSDNMNLSSVSTQTPRLAYSSAPQASHNTMSPVKITISKSSQGRGIPSVSHTQPSKVNSKVILVTSSGQSMTPTVIHKSPIVRASTATSTALAGMARGSIMMPSSPPVSMSSANIVTVSSHSFTSPTSTISTNSSLMGSPPVFQPATLKPRFRTIPRQRFPVTQHKPGAVIPMSSQPVHPSPQSLQNLQVKTLNKPTIQIKQDGGMKIITQNIQGTTSKILPKPSHLAGSSSGTPVVVVNAGSGTQTSKVLNIATPGGRVIGTSKPNVVTVNPKTLHLTAVKTAGGTTVSKPNVIVVQKTQQRRALTPNTIISKTSSNILSNPSAFEKELVTFIQKQEGSQSTTMSTGKIGDKKVIITTASTGPSRGGAIVQRSKGESEGKTSSLLAELIQAAGIVPDSSTDTTGVTSSVGGNEWFEYDVTEEQAQALAAGGNTDPATLQAILNMSTPTQSQTDMEDKSDNVEVIDLDQVIEQPEHTPGHYYTLEQAMSLIEQSNTSAANTPFTVATQKERVQLAPAVIVQQNNPQIMPEMMIPVRQVNKEIYQITGQQQFIGELDPETGLFYTDKQSEAEIKPNKTSTSALDLIRSSLEEADINLDTFQYVVDPSVAANKVAPPTQAGGDNYQSQYGATIDLTEDEESLKTKTGKTTDATSEVIIPLSEIEDLKTTVTKPSTGFIPLQAVSSTIVSPAVSMLTKTQTTDALGNYGAGDSASDIHVMVRKEAELDPFKLSELTSQQIEDKECVMLEADTVQIESQDTAEDSLLLTSQSSIGSSSDSQGEGDSLRLSKRKRKFPSGLDDSQSSSAVTSLLSFQAGWVRSAAGLLQKVSKYRGVNREKGELNAASWFTQPVDPADAPDYYSIVKKPRDFGTIKKNLETGVYKEFEDFHADMLLVKDNCFLYNPPTSPVRGDCTDVFDYYQAEADKLIEKWQKSHIASPKKSKLDKSPAKS